VVFAQKGKPFDHLLKNSPNRFKNHDNSVASAMRMLHGSNAETPYCASAA
jgi:hypothetical protein